MNYRHGFHAGNAVDCAKHVLLVALLAALARKPAPYFYLETHAGRGRYRLGDAAARATDEARDGIQRLRAARVGAPPAVTAYLAAVDALNPDLPPAAPANSYPGSPALALAAARPGDRLQLCELAPDEASALAAFAGASAHRGDGWAALRAALPPRERRGLVLIDPPYERADEFREAGRALLEALGRWPSGTLALWYPLKAGGEAEGLERRVGATATAKTLRARFALRADGPGLLGCGMLVTNPPFRFADEAAEALAFLAATLAPGRGQASVDWLVPERGTD
jgi:23S rRNA (adenine2030-N6)-methyltransferase